MLTFACRDENGLKFDGRNGGPFGGPNKFNTTDVTVNGAQMCFISTIYTGNTMCSKTPYMYLKKKAIPERFSPMQVQVPPGVQIGRVFPSELSRCSCHPAGRSGS